jgi:hypothetical protein
MVLVLVTLLGALPVYRRVATESPYSEGSLAMLERILSWWAGKILVLVLLLENPYAPHFVHGHQFVVTLVLLAARWCWCSRPSPSWSPGSSPTWIPRRARTRPGSWC